MSEHPLTAKPAPKILPTGWPRVEFFDDRDKYYVPVKYFDLKSMSPLNLRTHADYKKYFIPFYDQSPPKTKLDGNCWGTCVANATAAAFAYEWNRQGLKPVMNPSRLFIYFNARNLAFQQGKEDWTDPKGKNPKFQGTYVRLACKVLEKLGVCTETDWGYDDDDFAAEPKPDAVKKAFENRALTYSRLDPDQPEGVEDHLSAEEKETIGAMTLLRLRQCLGEGYPVIFGFRYYWEDAPFKKDAKTGMWDIGPLPNKTGPTGDFGGHACWSLGLTMRTRRSYARIPGGRRMKVRPCSRWGMTGSRTLRPRATFG